MAAKYQAPLISYVILGAVVFLLGVSWMPLWWVEGVNTHLGEIRPGTFWEFMQNFPVAVEHLSVRQSVENYLAILPTVYLPRNLGTSLVVLGVGASLGLTAYWAVNRRRRDGRAS